MAPITQDKRPLRITSPLATNALIAVRLVGQEEVSRPYVYTVDCLSENSKLVGSDLLGKPVTLFIEQPEDSSKVRHVHGLVRRFSNLGAEDKLYRYRLEVVPKMWFLTLSSDCRIFEKQSVSQILTTVLQNAGITFKFKVAATLSALPYVTQYRETNFDFFSRMLEEFGLYYCFEHTSSTHTLVITDAHAGTIPANEVAQAEIDDRGFTESPKAGTVFRLTRDFAVHTAKIDLANHQLLMAEQPANQLSKLPTAFSGSESHDFVGDLLRPLLVADDAKYRIEGAEQTGDVISGASNYVMFRAGTRVKIPRGAYTGDVHLLSVTHKLEIGDVEGGGGLSYSYANEFTAIPAERKYRPPRVTPKPRVHGTQTAKITGKGGIDVDADGRVLLIFPWNRTGGSTAYRVHVASVWAGTGWGFVQHPRVGQEVLVEYLDGDVDRPIVVGRVYNKDNVPPYTLPANKTQSGWKSRTLDGGDSNFNEIRFEDKKGSEQIYSQAEKDLSVFVKNDETRKVDHDRTTTIKNHDKRTVTEGNDEHTISKGYQKVTVSEGDQTIAVSKGKQTITVKADQALTVNDGNRTTTVEKGNDTHKVSMGNMKVDVSMGNIEIKAGMGKITVEAMQKIELKVGGNSIVIDMTGITVKGTMVKIEGQAMAEMKSPMTKVEGSGMMTVKGAMTQVNGDGILIAKGGITMIN